MDPGLRRDDGVDVDGHFNVTPAKAGVQGLRCFPIANYPLS
jgi:hypothetical protein